jgi:hypothetical protein
VFGDGAFAVGAAAADTPPASAKDTPAAPHTGRVNLERRCFEAFFARAMAETSHICEQIYKAR